MKKQNPSLELRIMEGRQNNRWFRVNGELFCVGRPDPSTNWEPEIDLTPDFKVSRKHARVFFKDGNWWIEDMGSALGTLVNGSEIKGLSSPTKLSHGTEVRMGKTIWMLSPHEPCLDDLEVEIEVPPINYALYHCDMPVISSLKITNRGASNWPSFSMSINIKGYSHPWHQDFEGVAAGGHIDLGKIHLELDYEKLQGLENRDKAELTVKVNNNTVVSKDIYIRGFYEWSNVPDYRKSLACFIQPAHPVVGNIVADTVNYLDRDELPVSFTRIMKSDIDNKADYIAKVFYDCLCKSYDIRYAYQAPSFEFDSQVIRPPHRVIPNPPEIRGEGTCIDLALLMAACLEYVRLQPLVFLVKENDRVQHAFIGCWTDVTERYEPILTDFEKLKKALETQKLLILETTGITDRWGKKLSFEEAVNTAKAHFTPEEFIFALDVAAARQTVVPLQFPMNPNVMRIIRKGEALARREGSQKLETRHILLGFLQEGNKSVREIIRQAGVDASLSDSGFQTVRGYEGSIPRPTINYRRLLEDARFIAGDSGVKFVEEEHLFYALLLSQSESVDNILEHMGTDRETVKKAFEERFVWIDDVLQTYFEFSTELR